jgi:hypothetical protein
MTSERQRGDEVVTIELAGTQTIDAIDFSLGPRREFDYPRRLVIEVSDDGAAWRAAWQGDTVATAVAGAFRDPARVSLRFEFEPTPARFVRLRQTSRTRAAFWAMAELAVLAR